MIDDRVALALAGGRGRAERERIAGVFSVVAVPSLEMVRGEDGTWTAMRPRTVAAYTRKNAASRREKLYEVEIGGETQVVNGSQLAGLRAAVARREKQAKQPTKAGAPPARRS